MIKFYRTEIKLHKITALIKTESEKKKYVTMSESVSVMMIKNDLKTLETTTNS